MDEEEKEGRIEGEEREEVEKRGKEKAWCSKIIRKGGR